MPVRIEPHDDHVVVRMHGPSVVSSLRRAIVIPYSDIVHIDVAPPRWPPVIVPRIGTHLPGVIASGTFYGWNGQRRFLHFDRKAEEVLVFRLVEHPDFHEVSVAVSDATAALVAVRSRAGRKAPPT